MFEAEFSNEAFEEMADAAYRGHWPHGTPRRVADYRRKWCVSVGLRPDQAPPRGGDTVVVVTRRGKRWHATIRGTLFTEIVAGQRIAVCSTE